MPYAFGLQATDQEIAALNEVMADISEMEQAATDGGVPLPEFWAEYADIEAELDAGSQADADLRYARFDQQFDRQFGQNADRERTRQAEDTSLRDQLTRPGSKQATTEERLTGIYARVQAGTYLSGDEPGRYSSDPLASQPVPDPYTDPDTYRQLLHTKAQLHISGTGGTMSDHFEALIGERQSHRDGSALRSDRDSHELPWEPDTRSPFTSQTLSVVDQVKSQAGISSSQRARISEPAPQLTPQTQQAGRPHRWNPYALESQGERRQRLGHASRTTMQQLEDSVTGSQPGYTYAAG